MKYTIRCYERENPGSTQCRFSAEAFYKPADTNSFAWEFSDTSAEEAKRRLIDKLEMRRKLLSEDVIEIK